MTRFILFIIVLTIIGAFLAQWLIEDAGYIFIRLGDTTIEATLWMGILITIVALGILVIIYKIFQAGVLFPVHIKQAFSQRKNLRQQKQLISYLLYLVSGNYNKIYSISQSLFSNSDSLEIKIINAEAFLHKEHYEELIKTCADIQNYATKAKLKGNEKSQVIKATDILMARAYIDQSKYSRTIKLLQSYIKDADTEINIFNLLKTAYIGDKRWQELGELLTKYGKGYNETQDDISTLLSFYENSSNIKNITKHWKSLDKASKKNPNLVSAYAHACAKSGDKLSAIEILQESIKDKYDPALATAYKEIISDTPLQQLKFLEDSKKDIRTDEMLLVALAKLSNDNKLEAKAKGYYEELLKNYPNTSLENKLNYMKILRASKNSIDNKKTDEVLLQILDK